MKKILFLILILQRTTLCSQPVSSKIQTLDNILKLRWTYDIGEWSPYDGQPLIYKDMIFPYQNVEYALKAENGKKIPYASKEMQKIIRDSEDSLILFANFHKNKQKTEHRAISVISGETLVNKPAERFFYLGYSAPSVVKYGAVYFPQNRNSLIAVNVATSEIIWEYNADSPICTEPKVRDNSIYFSDEHKLYALDRQTGREKWRKELGEIVSSLEIEGKYIYLWTKPVGLSALNLDTQAIAWTFNDVPMQNDNYSLLVEENAIFFSSESIFAINKKDGSLIWRSEYEDSKSSIHITSLGDYILYYDVETDDDVPPLTALNKQTGEIKYQYFTSETYPQDFDNERKLNSLDYATMKFVRNPYDNMIFGAYHGKIYAFEILKP